MLGFTGVPLTRTSTHAVAGWFPFCHRLCGVVCRGLSFHSRFSWLLPLYFFLQSLLFPA